MPTSYSDENYAKMMEIITINNGKIDHEYIEQILTAYQISSGQAYYFARIKAVIDYIMANNQIRIICNGVPFVLNTVRDLDNYLKRYDSTINVQDL